MLSDMTWELELDKSHEVIKVGHQGTGVEIAYNEYKNNLIHLWRICNSVGYLWVLGDWHRDVKDSILLKQKYSTTFQGCAFLLSSYTEGLPFDNSRDMPFDKTLSLIWDLFVSIISIQERGCPEEEIRSVKTQPMGSMLKRSSLVVGRRSQCSPQTLLPG